MNRTLLPLLIGFGLMLAPVQMLAKTECTNADVKGNFVWVTAGVLAPEFGPPGPFLRLGRSMPDGTGIVRVANISASYAGLVLTGDEASGTYTVNPDCTIVVNLLVPPPLNQVIPLVGVIGDGAKLVKAVVAAPSPGTTGWGTLTRQAIRDCTTGSFVGNFQVELAGDIASTPPGKFHGVGTLVSPGDGTFTATTLSTFNGLIVPEAVSGTYTVDSRCFVSLNYTATSQAGSRKGSIIGLMFDRDKVQLLVLDAGFVVGGTLVRQ